MACILLIYFLQSFIVLFTLKYEKCYVNKVWLIDMI